MKKPKRTSLDLFAGAGGLSTGLEMAGFDVLWANEVMPAYSESLAYNHPKAITETADIREVDAGEVRKTLGVEKGELDLLAGGPPCQGFSINAPIRSTKDERNHLFLDFLRFVEEFQPKTVLIENVPGIVSYSSGETVQAILNSLEQFGYQVDLKILYAAHFGVPQMRWRAIFIGSRFPIEPNCFFPEPTHKAVGRANFRTNFKGQKLVYDDAFIVKHSRDSFVTVTEAISDLPEIPNGGGCDQMDYDAEPQSHFQSVLRQGSKEIFNHRCAGLGAANLVRLPHIPQGGSWRNIPRDLLPAGMKRARRSDHTKRYGRLHPEGIASTILTKCDPHWGSYIHPEQDRILSVREAARFQSFPDTIRFLGKLPEQYKQVGNAVPPLFGRALGDRINEILTLFENNKSLPEARAKQLSLWKD
jgi:DNA (cytosine-5)-methyltransferase 1